MAAAFTMAFALAPGRATVVHADGDDVALTGCVVQGNDDGDGYLLTNVLPASIDMSTREDRPAGTSGNLPGASSVIYLLDDMDKSDDLSNYAGKRVEVTGEVEGDIKKGEMQIERDGDWVKMEIKAAGKKVTTRIPWVSLMPNTTDTNAVGTSGKSHTLKEDQEIELNVNVRKLDVKGMKIVSGACS
jgi:hypothetical protein